MCGPPGWTNNGYEIQFGVNYLAHALWIQKLLPLLQRTSEIVGDARIVFLTSTAFAIAPKQGIVFEALKAERENNTFGSKWTRYGQSKLAMVLYGKQLAKRYPNITSISVHPGVIRTSLIYDLPFVDRLFIEAITLGQKIGVEEGAYTTCWAATAPRNENLMSGGIYQPVGKPLSETKLSSNVNLGDRLWNWTAEHLKPYIVSSRAQGLITPTGGYPVTSALEKLHKLPSV